MAKYLIEDIVPADKKHRLAKHGHHTTHRKTTEVTKQSDPKNEVLKEETLTKTHETIHHQTYTNEIEGSAYHENPRDILISEMRRSENKENTAVTPPPNLQESSVEPTDSKNLNSPLFPVYDAYRKKTDKKNSGWYTWILGFGAITVLIFFVLNFFFFTATIFILPKHETPPLDALFTAESDPQDNTLPFAVMKVSIAEESEVPATGTKTVTTKASGDIVVFNEQATPQRLIKNTRFQNPSGKIYRINESITVPKATTISGKLVPGSLAVTVYADEAGPEYNSDPADFSIPGLKGYPQYSKVYARSKGSVAGGESGTIKVVSDADMKQAGDALRVRLETKLRGKARSDLSPTQIMYDNGIAIELGEANLSTKPASSADKAVITQQGEIFAIVFNRTSLSKEIVKKLIPTYNNEDISIKNLDSLKLSMEEQNGKELESSHVIKFNLSGTPEIEWVVNADEIKNQVLSLPKSDFNGLLSKYTTIERAKATLRPFWKTHFPGDPSKISVKLTDSLEVE